ncbi:MAG TPA: hypothetical protein VGM12_30015 [Trebonia sp.]
MPDLADRAEEQFSAAYPDERERDLAARWLGLLACQAKGGLLRWWEVPGLASALAVLTVRWAVLLVPTAAVLAWGITGARYNAPGSGYYAAFICVVCGIVLATLRRGRRRPRSSRAAAPAAAGRPGVTPAGTYLAARKACIIRTLALVPAGLAIGALATWGTSEAPWVMAADAIVAAAWGALKFGPYPLLKLSELELSVRWEERVRFLPLLEDAAGRGVLLRGAGAYGFGDPAVAAWLAGRGRAALAGYAQRQARRLAGRDPRAVLARFLTPGRIKRMAVDTALGAGVAAGIGVSLAIWSAVVITTRWTGVAGGVLAGAVVAGGSGAAGYWLLRSVVRGCRTSLVYLPLTSRRGRWAAGAAAAAAVVALVVWAGPALAGAAAFLLPSALVAACGGWACVLAYRKTRALPRWWQRAAPDVIAAATAGAALSAAFDHRLLTAMPAAGLLFPAAAWGSFLLWRRMNGSARVAVKAAADLVLALLLGGELVLLLVWLANVLGLPRREVAALRDVLDRAGTLADLPWWAWTGTWVLLAAASVAFVRWPIRLKKAARRFERWRVAAVAEITERALTGLHVGLLALVFVGLAAPPALMPALSGQLRAEYTSAYQRELLDEGELAAYTAIARQLAAQPRSPVLSQLVTKLHDLSPPDERQDGQQDASGTETSDARRLGEAQAAALVLAGAPALGSAAAAEAALNGTARDAATSAGFDQRPDAATDLAGTAATVQHEDTAQDDAAKRVESAADLAAKVVASLVAVPRLSDSEVLQVVREYLAGLIEDSPLKDTFAAWIKRLPGAQPPPEATAEVVPVPAALADAATAQLSAEFTDAGDSDPVTDPFIDDPALTSAQAEDPLDGAVDIVNQARYASDRSGPCSGCTLPGGSGDEPPGEEPPEEHELEP